MKPNRASPIVMGTIYTPGATPFYNGGCDDSRLLPLPIPLDPSSSSSRTDQQTPSNDPGSSSPTKDDSCPFDLEAFLAYSESSGDEQPADPKTRDVLYQQELDLKRSKIPFRKDDIVWRLFVYNLETRTKRKVQISDWQRSLNDFQESGEDIRGYIYVVKIGKITRQGQGRKAGLLMVNNGLELYDQINDWVERVPYGNIYRYKPEYTHVILDKIRGSRGDLETQPLDLDPILKCIYSDYRKALQYQLDVIYDFFDYRKQFSAIRATEFLVRAVNYRDLYLNQFKKPPSPETKETNGQTNLSGEAAEIQSPASRANHVSEEEDESDRGPPPPEVEDFPSRASKQRRIQPSDRNQEILTWFQSDLARSHLNAIMADRVPSRRHKIFTSDTRAKMGVLESVILRLTSPTFLEDDNVTILKLHEFLVDHVFDLQRFAAITKRDAIFMDHYVEHCLVPEGCIRYLQDKHNLSPKEAERLYLTPIQEFLPPDDFF
ncbi:hypothetical protein TCAL_15656 [Tigriopus californicus]|uniref:Uncharacterized protein n=1 Tax=Tigriopus californicus TaxID=6832 RepID=A0A553P9Y6_TIGCA|nr:hypothetical protein TCAL_15656 [Tigriopus californicus]